MLTKSRWSEWCRTIRIADSNRASGVENFLLWGHEENVTGGNEEGHHLLSAAIYFIALRLHSTYDPCRVDGLSASEHRTQGHNLRVFRNHPTTKILRTGVLRNFVAFLHFFPVVVARVRDAKVCRMPHDVSLWK